VLTKVKRVTPTRYEGRHQFCRQHVGVALDPGLKEFRARMPAVLGERLGVGPNPRAWRLELNRRISVAKTGKAVTLAQRRHLEDLWAALRRRTKASAEYMGLIREAVLDGKNATELLILEYRAKAPDAKAFIRKHMSQLPRRRPRYKLDDVHGFLQAGRSRRWIADKLGLKESRARQVIALVRSLDSP
jgi:hypothetical protein